MQYGAAGKKLNGLVGLAVVVESFGQSNLMILSFGFKLDGLL